MAAGKPGEAAKIEAAKIVTAVETLVDVTASAADIAKKAADEKAAADERAEAQRDKVAADLRDATERQEERELRKERYAFWQTIIVAVVAGIPAIIGAGGVAYNVIQVQTAAIKLEELDRKSEVLNHSVNSIKDELVEEVRAASFAKGKLEGEKQRDRKEGTIEP